ncbi:hypothetical protein C8A01DRAFT_19534 [Parachaetomium inaequale]|uniref:Uncharacterized protein n=1 Tax=Parachaetomium inaequale TaxID=2588326 RepID=A0AAN6SM71_9PEZI|nr:hypothetical protein C8A01DRAFT_19534 [Parachaetomium inaequale]
MAPLPPLQDLSSSARALFETAASALHPTRTLPHLLHQRQSQTTPDGGGTVTVTPTTTTDNESSDPDAAKTLSGGAIAGIVIGSIAGFLLLLWIIRSCTNLGAPPGEAVPGRPWYGGVKGESPPPPPPGHHHHHGRGRSPGGRSRSRHSRHEGYSHHRHGRSRSRRASVVEAVPVQEVAPVAVVREGRRSRSRGYYGYGEGVVRDSRSRSRGRY